LNFLSTYKDHTVSREYYATRFMLDLTRSNLISLIKRIRDLEIKIEN